MPHINELIDYTVNVFVVYQNKVLLRYHDKYKFWGGASGHVELDETPEVAAVRETVEEVGLKIVLYDQNKPDYSDDERVNKLIAPIYMDIHKISDTHKHIGMVYFASSDSDIVNPQESKDRSDVWKWVTEEEIENMTDIWQDMKFYALKALDCLANKSK